MKTEDLIRVVDRELDSLRYNIKAIRDRKTWTEETEAIFLSFRHEEEALQEIRTILARPENLNTGAIRLTLKKEALYGEEGDAKEEDVMRSALKTFGGMKQVMKAVEELSELQKELCKYYSSEEDKDNIAEEIADVRIMLDQMAMLFDIERDELEWREQKLERLAGRLGL